MRPVKNDADGCVTMRGLANTHRTLRAMSRLSPWPGGHGWVRCVAISTLFMTDFTLRTTWQQGLPQRRSRRRTWGVNCARQASAGFIIGGLHVLGIVAWWNMTPEMSATRTPGPLSWVTLSLPEPPPPASVRSAPKDQTLAAPSPLLPQRDPNPRAPTELATGSIPEAAAPETPLPAPALNLTLPRGELAAILAPKIPGKSQLPQRLPKTVETIIADAFGESGPWTEERIDFDHIRLRRGNTCIMLERSVTESLFPFDEASRRVPWKANTYRCQ